MGFWDWLFGARSASGPASRSDARYTMIGCSDSTCPYCGHRFEKMPQRKKECPGCKNVFYCRTRPLDTQKVLVTKDQVIEIDRQNDIRRGLFDSRQQRAYNDVRNEMGAKLGKDPSNYEIMTSFLIKECQYLSSRDDWGLFTNVLSKQAQLSTLVGNDREALAFYLTICYLDLNGPNNLGGIGRMPGIKRFDPQDWPLPPGNIKTIIELIGSLNLSKAEVKKLFFDYNKMILSSLRLPISMKKAWDMIEKEIFPDEDLEDCDESDY